MGEPASELPDHRRLAGLDGLRAIAVAAVLLHHVGYAPAGFVGVDLFFVLSGFLITSILVAQRDRGGIRLLTFSARRLLRLYPALLVLVLGVLAVSAVSNELDAEVLHDAGAAVTYTGNLVELHGLMDHVWTLAIEEQFYLIWPSLLIIATRWRRLGYLPAIALLAAVLMADLMTDQSTALHTYVRAMGLPLGCLLAINRSFRSLASPWGPVALAVLCAGFFLEVPYRLLTGWPGSLGALLAVPAVAWLARSAPRGLTSAPVLWLGIRSYSLYLWHFPITSLVLNHGPAMAHPLQAVAVIAASLVAADLSYRLVERPVLDWRDRRVSAEPRTPAS